jgi:sugar lactone lactonase YvrE
VESEGYVWSAVWGAHKVVRIDPSTGQVVATVSIGAERASSCMFGGKDLRTLFITTCSQDFAELAKAPLPAPAGALFAVHLPEPFAPGLPEPAFAG